MKLQSLKQKLLDIFLASAVAVGLGIFLSEYSKLHPQKFGGFPPNVVTTTASSAFLVAVALLLFRKRTPDRVEVLQPVTAGDDTLPVFEKKQHWTMDCTTAVSTVSAKKGYASHAVCPPMTIIQAFETLLDQESKSEWLALTVERPVPPPKAKGMAPSLPSGMWTSWTYGDYYRESALAARGFMYYGLEMFGCVAIWGFNAPEWHMSAIGAILAGGKPAGIYPTDSISQVKFKLQHSGAAVAVVDDASKLERVLSLADELPDLRVVVTMSHEFHHEQTFQKRAGLPDLQITTWTELCNIVEEHPETDGAEFDERKRRVKPGHCCALVYTSGTTGDPKAVMISHDNVVYEIGVLLELFRGLDVPEQIKILSYLPLSHIAGMMVDIFLPIVNTMKLNAECTTFFARPYDMKEGTLKFRLQFVRPTFFIGVPRVYEKIAEKLRSLGAATTGVKRTVATWAKSKGYEHALACQLGGDGSYPSLYGLAEGMMLKLIKKNLGLDEAMFCVSAAAPISVDLLQYFGSLSVSILELYGMSESTGATTINTVNTKLWGSCGFAIPGAEVAILAPDPSGKSETFVVAPLADDLFHLTEEEQGEVCYRGRHIMMGYMANPKLGPAHMEEIAKKNAGTIDEDGWLHSGDMGSMDRNGMVRITGRYKELIIGAGGENVAPVPIEDNLKNICPAISNVMMVGDQRKYNVVLITLRTVGATGEAAGTNILDGPAMVVNPEVVTTEAAAQDPVWKAYLSDIIGQTNRNASVVASNVSTIQKFAILPRDFSVETGEFTPTFKLRRDVTRRMWSTVIDGLYEE
eukprot:GEMP01004894.1.p1 GENE.GEMP01004894.1~~GEMP01004894.1.p1  ORF type:complete len:805 (+),score=217.53 GEMP01004894.1:206-2620(+)